MAEKTLPNKILCVCIENTVRSVMLESLLFQYTNTISAGIDVASFSNPIVQEVVKANGIDFQIKEPEDIDDIDLDDVDLIITLSEDAYRYIKSKELHKKCEVEQWVTARPPVLGEVPRQACFDAYQNIFNELVKHIENSFEIKVR